MIPRRIIRKRWESKQQQRNFSRFLMEQLVPDEEQRREEMRRITWMIATLNGLDETEDNGRGKN